jgi:hypothetical protein
MCIVLYICFQILYEAGKISLFEIEKEEPESKMYPARPVPFSYVEHYAPSNSALLRFGATALLAFFGVSFYVFFFSWKGALFWRWFKWQNDLDDYDMKNLSKYFKIPSWLYHHVTNTATTAKPTTNTNVPDVSASF